MGLMIEVQVARLAPERFEQVLEEDSYRRFAAGVARAGDTFAGRVIWNINSTARGGGVAEMLQSLLSYARGAGVDARWMVIEGTPEFFAITKRIHNLLHGFPGDGGPLGPHERRVYGDVADRNADELSRLVRPNDVVILHDPQTAGLCRAMIDAGAVVVWRCHVGVDIPNDEVRTAWRFLRPYVKPAHAYVFSRLGYAWSGLDRERIVVIPPSIDAFSPKNQDLDGATTLSILAAAGLVDAEATAPATFEREDGSPGTVVRRAELHGTSGPPSLVDRLVVQVSRWDRLKDPVGVIRAFAEHVTADDDVRLMLAGPSTRSVADDPEGAEVLAESREAVCALPPRIRRHVHLASLPMDDREENAAIVNALQRHATVVLQKSLAEGFGLTVAEAMWKARPVVASRIGGIQDQIVDGETGLLVDPTDGRAVGHAVTELLQDHPRAEHMGQRARNRVRAEFLGPRHLLQYLELLDGLQARP